MTHSGFGFDSAKRGGCSHPLSHDFAPRGLSQATFEAAYQWRRTSCMKEKTVQPLETTSTTLRNYAGLKAHAGSIAAAI
ncbi:hypothetical protein TcWFU_009046 [Taenia crassiceps]|uniref:Uncharacterized protein n=1 Tax=Taenia crassiceps TaxID=6207 RepID=A0ABR4Q490_9CEST